MDVQRVGIGWPLCSGLLQRMSDGTTVVSAVIEDVEQDFLLAHAAGLAIGKHKTDDLRRTFRRESGNMAGQPGVGCQQAALQLIQRGQLHAIGGGMRCRQSLQAGAEQLFTITM